MSGKNRFMSVVLATMLLLSVVAGAFAGSAVAFDHGAEYDAVLTDGGLYWQGQTLNFTDSNVSAGDKLILRKVTDSGDKFVAEVSANSNGTVFVDTSDREGAYYLENQSGTKLVDFEVAAQSISASADDDTVYNKEDVPSNTVNFTLDSNRAGYDVVVREANGSLGIDELEQIFADESYSIKTDSNGKEYFVVSLSSNTEDIEGNFSGISTGDYNMEFIVEDTGVTATENITVSAPGDQDAKFSNTVYTEHVGDTVRITVNLDNTETAKVAFGDTEHSGYSHNVTVSNVDNGTVTLLFDTAEAGDGDAQSPWSLPSGSDASITPGAQETTLNTALEAYNYGLTVSVDGFDKHLATVNLAERNTEGVSVYTLPKNSEADFEAIRNNATETDTVANGDYVVAQIKASGIYANLDNSTTAADLENGSAFANANGFYISLADKNPGLNQGPKTYDVSQGNVIVDAENDTFYVVWNTANLANNAGETPSVNFTMTQANPYIDTKEEADAQSASSEFEFVERKFEYNNVNNDGVIEVVAQENATVSGDTTAAPGTEVAVTLRAEQGAERPFIITKNVKVNENQKLEANIDMSQYAPGTNFTVSVSDLAPSRHAAVLLSAGPTEHTVEVTVEGPNGAIENATVEVGGMSYETDANGTTSVTVVEGDHTFTANADGFQSASKSVEVTNNSPVTFTLEPEPTKYTYEVEVVDQDGNAVSGATVSVDGDSYTTNDNGVASVSLTEGDYEFSASAEGYSSASQTVQVSADGSFTLTLESETTTKPSDNTTTKKTTTPGQPGFGVAVGLVALLGAALLALRKD